MDKKVVECFFIVDKATPLKPVPSQPMGSQRAPTTAADLLSRQWEGKITYMNPTLSEDDLSPSTWIFCLPEGLWFYRKENIPKPTIFTFMLTKVDGTMRPVTCLVTYEEYHIDTEVIYSPKCYCILSSHPTGDFTRKWLQIFNRELHTMNTESRGTAIRELLGFTYNNSPETILSIGSQKFQEKVLMPIEGGLPVCHNNAFWLINSIGLGNVVNIILWLLQEEKVLFVSSNLPILSQCIETIGSLLYPFSWSFLYVTVLPTPLIDYTQSPMPFMIGFLRSAFMSIKRKEIPEGAMIVDLDYGTVMGSNTPTNVPPPHLVKQLFSDLRHANDIAIGMDDPLGWNSWDGINTKRLMLSNLVIRGAFLRFFASLLRDHRRYIQFLRLLPKPHAHFSSDAFVQSFDKDSKSFVKDMIMKQMFLAFIENRPWPIGDSFDTAINANIWSMPMKELPCFMEGLMNGTVRRPVFGIPNENQMVRTEGLTEEAKAAYDKAIAMGVPALVNFRAESLDFLKKSISEQYFRIQFCVQLREYLHSKDKRAWEVSENAGRLIGDFLGFMITESAAKNDFVTLKLIAAILHKCRYQKGTEVHYLCERSGSSSIWKDANTWEEIFCLIMTSTLQRMYSEVKVDEKWNDILDKDATKYANREWEETRVEFAFLVSIMESLDVPPIVMKKLMPVVIVNFDETKYQELIELLEPTTMAKLKAVDTMEDHPLPQNLIDANAIVCWVDDKINEPTLLMNVKFVKDEAQRTKKSFILEIQTFPSSTELKDWLCTYGSRLSDKIRIVTNRYRQFDGCDKAAELVFRVVREDAKLPTVPVLIFCGNPSLAEPIIKGQQYGYADSDIRRLCDFCINGKPPK